MASPKHETAMNHIYDKPIYGAKTMEAIKPCEHEESLGDCPYSSLEIEAQTLTCDWEKQCEIFAHACPVFGMSMDEYGV